MSVSLLLYASWHDRPECRASSRRRQNQGGTRLFTPVLCQHEILRRALAGVTNPRRKFGCGILSSDVATHMSSGGLTRRTQAVAAVVSAVFGSAAKTGRGVDGFPRTPKAPWLAWLPSPSKVDRGGHQCSTWERNGPIVSAEVTPRRSLRERPLGPWHKAHGACEAWYAGVGLNGTGISDKAAASPRPSLVGGKPKYRYQGHQRWRSQKRSMIHHNQPRPHDAYRDQLG